MDSIVQFFRSAHTQWRGFTTRHSSLLLTSRKAQTFIVMGISTVCALLVVVSLLSATRAREQWTQSREVVVAKVDLAPGDVLNNDNTHRISLPIAIVSADALDALPENASVRLAVRAQTVLSSSLVSTSHETVAIPPGWRIVALPTSLSAPPLTAGDAIEIVGGTSVIAASALVASTDPLTVAVPAEVSAAVAAAARLGEISIVVSR